MLSPVEQAAEREAIAVRLAAERGIPLRDARAFMDWSLGRHQRGRDLIAWMDRFPQSLVWSQVFLWDVCRQPGPEPSLLIVP